MRLVAAVVCLGVLVVAGCSPVGSIHSLYQPDEAPYFLPSLQGTWYSADPKVQETWVFRKGKQAGTYEIKINATGHATSNSGQVTGFMPTVRLVRVGELVFIDNSPTSDDPGSPSKGERSAEEGWPAPALVGLHTFQRVWVEPDRVRIAYLNADWWEQQKKQGTLSVHVEEITDGERGYRDVITSSTEELRAFVTQAAADPKAFGPAVVLVRTNPTPPARKPSSHAKRKRR